MPYATVAQKGTAPQGGAPLETLDLDSLFGTVTQITSTTTAVTLNKRHGTITTIAGTLAAAAEETFVVNNDQVRAGDVVVASIQSYGGAGTPLALVSRVADGSFSITVANLHASAALDALITINFHVFKKPRT